jgi:hypothetical protein
MKLSGPKTALAQEMEMDMPVSMRNTSILIVVVSLPLIQTSGISLKSMKTESSYKPTKIVSLWISPKFFKMIL